MSMETLSWLNENTLIGFTEKRGHAWHYRQGSNNHYSGAIPVEDVRSRLFNWDAVELPLYVPQFDQGSHSTDMIEVPGRKAIARSDNGFVMGVFTDGYRPHQYSEWLIDNVQTIISDDLQIGSAGLLRGGSQAWVSIEIPETITTPDGVAFRPNLLAVTSFDGSLSTTYKRVVTNVVCDNTMAYALNREEGQEKRVRHSKRSLGRIGEIREALAIVHTMADDFAAEVKELCATSFTDLQFDMLVDQFAPMPDDSKSDPESAGFKRAEGRANAKRDKLHELWEEDDRVSPWRGNAFGAWQALNTFSQHEGSVRGGNRVERNMTLAVTGKAEQMDADAVRMIMALTA